MHRSPTVQPCSVTWWPTVTLLPTRGAVVAVRDVDDRVVLDRRVLADADVEHVAAQDGAEPDARARADGRRRR